MSNNVFANGRAISCKSGDGKVIAAFPDVCLSPPSPPAGPVPIPYPLFSFSRDTASGSKSVMINGKEVMLKDKSYFKRCQGDEPATKALGQGVITHTLGGKVYFNSWSMDVIIEGENVVRHLDATTSNHASPMANQAAPLPEIEGFGFDLLSSCAGQPDRCRMQTQSQCNRDSGGRRTGHHVVPDHCSKVPGKGNPRYAGCSRVTREDAPCICVTGKDKSDATQSGRKRQHGRIHDIFDKVEGEQPNNVWTYAKCRDAGCAAAAKVTGCGEQCLKDQCDQYYIRRCKMKESTRLRADPSGQREARGLRPTRAQASTPR